MIVEISRFVNDIPGFSEVSLALLLRQHIILDYANQLLKVDWDLIIMSIFLHQICGWTSLRISLTMNGA